MFSKNKAIFSATAVFAFILGFAVAFSARADVASVNEANLPINATKNSVAKTEPEQNNATNSLVSPSKASPVPQGAAENKVQTAASTQSQTAPVVKNTASPVAQPHAATQTLPNAASAKDDFNFDLKMKSINAPAAQKASVKTATSDGKESAVINEVDLPKDIQYKANPVESLGNSILSQLDGDLFSQMSEIEKSTTLLTLELRREKLRNEIEAQKAIRQKSIDDQERLKAEQKLKDLEKQKNIEAQVLQEKQNLLDKEKIFEVLKQRKLLNAYMNQMLVSKQEWLKEKENLYVQIAALENEKKELIGLFKERIDKVLEASAKNIQVAEAAKANFERIVKNLKARNEQLRKRVEADAQIIKNAKNNLYLKSQSIEELKNKNASGLAQLATATSTDTTDSHTTSKDDEEVAKPEKLSAKYAILGITGSAGNMTVEVIGTDSQPLALKVGSPLPTGHILSEVGADYAKFSRDGTDDYLYIGRSIDGFVPTLDVLDEKKK